MSPVAEHIKQNFSPRGWPVVFNAITDVIKTMMISDAEYNDNDDESLDEKKTMLHRVVTSLSSDNTFIQACLNIVEPSIDPLPASSEIPYFLQGIRDAVALIEHSLDDEDVYAFKDFIFEVANKAAQAYTEYYNARICDEQIGAMALIKTALFYNRKEWMTVVSAIPNATAAIMSADMTTNAMQSFKEGLQEAQKVSELLKGSSEQGILAQACLAWYRQMSEMPEAQWELEKKLQVIRDAAHIVEAKAEDEATWFKQLVFDTANHAAEAYAEQEGTPVSDKETAVLARIRQSLGISV